MDHFQTLLQPAQVIAGGYQFKNNLFPRPSHPPKGLQQTVAGLKSLSVYQ